IIGGVVWPAVDAASSPWSDFFPKSDGATAQNGVTDLVDSKPLLSHLSIGLL
ncbi:Dihydroorotase, partial [Clarias magur]